LFGGGLFGGGGAGGAPPHDWNPATMMTRA